MIYEGSQYFTDFEAALEEAKFLADNNRLGRTYAIQVVDGMYRVTRTNLLQRDRITLEVGSRRPDPVDIFPRWVDNIDSSKG